MASLIKTTNHWLYKYHKEIEGWSGSILFHFNRGRINDFYKHNSFKIESVMRRMDEIKKKYFELDEQGKIKMTDEEKPQMKYKQGMTSLEYHKEFNALMNEENTLTI